MFISIPKDFFVPVTFGDEFILNLDNMEFDTERNIENKDIKTKEKNNNSVKNDIEPTSQINNSDIYAVIDEEYVNSVMEAKGNK